MTTHSCEKCSATFKYKCSLVRHIKNNVCTKETLMKIFIEEIMDPESHAELWDIIGPI